MLRQGKHASTRERGWWLTDPASDRKAFGMVLHLRDGRWTVARTLIGSPAEKAGVLVGEKLVAIDEYQLGAGNGDMYEAQALMLADSSASHSLNFDTQSGTRSRNIEKL